MFNRKMLNPEERAEYDRIFEGACLDGNDEPRKTSAAAVDLLDGIADAIHAHKTWADYIHDDLVMSGYKAAARRWQNDYKKHKTIIDDKIVSRKDAMRIKRATASGKVEWQTSFFEDASAEDLAQLVNDSNVRIAAERATVRDCMRLMDLMESTTDLTVSAALKSVGLTLSEFLTDSKTA